MTKLHLRFIGPFKVITNKGLAYALILLLTWRTHPVFYVGLLNPYGDPSDVNLEVIAPRQLALHSAAGSNSGC